MINSETIGKILTQKKERYNDRKDPINKLEDLLTEKDENDKPVGDKRDFFR